MTLKALLAELAPKGKELRERMRPKKKGRRRGASGEAALTLTEAEKELLAELSFYDEVDAGRRFDAGGEGG